MDPKHGFSALSYATSSTFFFFFFINSCLQNILNIRCPEKINGHEPNEIPSHRKLPEDRGYGLGMPKETINKPLSGYHLSVTSKAIKRQTDCERKAVYNDNHSQH